jgi:hypothetical protein
MMEEKKEKDLEGLIADARAYVDTKLEYVHLRTVERGTKLFSDLVTNAMVIICFMLAFLMGTVTLALYLSNVFGSYVAGFGCVAGIYLFLSIIVFLTKDKYLDKVLVNLFIRKYFDKIADKDDEK